MDNISSIDRNVMDNISSIDRNVMDNISSIDGNVIDNVLLGAEVHSLEAEQGDCLDRSVPCPGSEDCALISAQPLALHRTRQLAETCSPTPQAALK
ncbi:unnamed protein product, partial [Staurois parvus]